MSRKSYLLLTTFILVFSLPISYAQETNSSFILSGTVGDRDGLPLIGATVQLENNPGIGTITDTNGSFRLNLPDGNQVLTVAYLGFTSQQVAVNNQSKLTIILEDSNNVLEEVVVIGYGEREKRDLTGSVSAIGSNEIEKARVVTPEMAMQGRLPGVLVSTPGGNPGARPLVRIRGVGTFGNAEPLYVIDGVPLTEFGSGLINVASREADLRGNVNPLSLINPNDIASISVLKDASASAIYGVRAANGVILITTKKGMKGAPRVELNLSRGTSQPINRYEVLNVDQYVALFREAYANDPNQAADLPAVFQSDSAQYLGNRPFVNWQDAVINDNGVSEDYSLKISGGSESTTYYVSGGYAFNESSLVQDNLKRYSLASNITSRVSKLLRVGATYRVGYVEALDNTSSDLRYASQASPWQPLVNSDGTFVPSTAVTFTKNETFDPNDIASGSAFNIDETTLLWGPQTRNNSLALMDINDRRYTLTRNTGTGFIELEPIEGLRFKGTLSVDWYLNQRTNFNDFDNYLYRQTPGNPYASNDGFSRGVYGEVYTRNFNLVKEFSINYVKNLRGHRFDLLLNAMDQRYTYNASASGTNQLNFSDPNLRLLTGPNQFTTVTAAREINTLQGYMARFSYNYNGKYYFDATVRRDGSSRFAPEFRWGIFPSFAAAWRLSAESFMQKVSFIDDLKIRVGWGQLGNQETAAFAFLSKVSFTPDYAFGSGNGNALGGLQFGARLPDLPNPLLSWETAETSNFGIDGLLFNNKVNFTFEVYKRLTKDILQSSQLTPSIGNENAPIINIASVQNTGIEFELGYNNQIGQFSYGVSGNITTVNNKVVSLYNDAPFGGEGGRVEVGQSLFYLWGYQVGGVFQSQAEIDAYVANTTDNINGNNFAPGDLYFKDVNQAPEGSDPSVVSVPGQDGVVDALDRTFLGNSIPNFYYGLNLTAGLKNLDISVFFQGVGDVYKYNVERANGECMCGTGSNMWTSTLNRWTPQNPSTTMPRAVTSDPAQNNRFSDRFIENASFLRLKNVQIGYTLPESLKNRLGFLNNLRLYISGSNLLTFTNWTGIDPEAIEAFNPNQVVPPVRTFIFGINAAF